MSAVGNAGVAEIDLALSNTAEINHHDDAAIFYKRDRRVPVMLSEEYD